MDGLDLDDVVRKTHYRAIFLSDIHLGTRGCQAQRLVAFLKGALLRCDLLGGRHRRRMASAVELLLATATQQRRSTLPDADSPRFHAGLRRRQPRRVPATVYRHRAWQHVAGRSSDTRDRRRQAVGGDPWRSRAVRRWPPTRSRDRRTSYAKESKARWTRISARLSNGL